MKTVSHSMIVTRGAIGLIPVQGVKGKVPMLLYLVDGIISLWETSSP